MTTTTKQPTCNQCGKSFESWDDLADHILTNSKSHKRSRKWAVKYKARKLKKAVFNHISPDPDYEPTEFGDENREKRRRQLSGETLYSNTCCPKCRQPHRVLLEAEFINDQNVWQIGGRIARLCFRCEK